MLSHIYLNHVFVYFVSYAKQKMHCINDDIMMIAVVM